MRNIKDQIYQALCQAFGEENVTDQYPANWAKLPAVQYTEEDNRSHEQTGEGETQSYVRYRIDIWDNRSTSEAAIKADQVIGCPIESERMEGVTPFGLCRTMCQDAPDPSGLKHKVMRYEGIIDMEHDYIYWTK